jgi:hypothetical protein
VFGCAAGTDLVVTGNLVAVAREVAVVDRGASRCGAAVAGDFDRAPVVKCTDHDFIGAVVMTDPHTLTQQRCRDGVLTMLEGDHGGVVGDPTCHAQRRGMREIGHPVQAGAFLVEHLGGTATSGAVHAGIDLGHERRTCCFQVGEGAVVRQQVRLGGNEIGFGEFDGVLHPTFGRRVGRLAGQHADTVVAPERDGRAVAHRDPGDVSGGHGLFIVGEQVGRCAAQDAKDPVQSREDAGRTPIPQRNHDPVSAPRQPRHQKHDLAPRHDRAIGEVVLQPQAGFGDPGSVHSCIAQSPLRFDFSQRTAGGSVGSGVSQPQESFVGFVAADLSLRIGDPPLQDLAPIIDHPGPPNRRR